MNTPSSSSFIEPLESRIAPAVFIVTTINDEMDGGTAAHPLGADGKLSLREALALADLNPATHDTIVFHLPAPATPHSENIISLSLGVLSSKGNVTILGPGAGKLAISGGGSSGVFSFNDGSATDSPVTIAGLSIIDGSATVGGGIFSAESLALKNSVVSGNTANVVGGGIDVAGSAATVSIVNSLISRNTATDFGGGMDLAGVKAVAITNSIISGNTATNDSGGGIYARTVSTGSGILIRGDQVLNNTASIGGGLFLTNENTAPKSKTAIVGTKITNNTSTNTGASASGGGGVFLASGNSAIIGSVIRGNTAALNGGGIEAGSGFNSLGIVGSVISGNQTTSNTSGNGGGGVSIHGSSGSTTQLANISTSLFSDNRSAYDGGGLLATGGVAVTISRSTFAGNHATDGGGVSAIGSSASKADILLDGVTLADNTASNAGGGVEQFGAGALTVLRSQAVSNSSDSLGGGLFAQTTGAVTINKSVVALNSAGDGGGLELFSASSFSVSGSVFTRNEATLGGGVFIDASTGSIINSSIIGNAATSSGGGVFQTGSGAVTLQIAKVIANTAPASPNVAGTFTFV